MTRQTKSHGILCSPGDGNGPSGPPPGSLPREMVGGRSGGVPPTPPDDFADKPVPVVLTARTLLKLVVGMVGPLIVVVSAALYFFHQTRTHIQDTNIHLGKNERSKLETKAEAKEQRKTQLRTIKAHIDVKIREVKVEQKEQIQKVAKDLKAQQRRSLERIIDEMKQTRRAIRTTAPAAPP